jgi:hypothetical protein
VAEAEPELAAAAPATTGSPAAAADGPNLTPAQMDQLTDMVFRLVRQELQTARERRGEPQQRSWR